MPAPVTKAIGSISFLSAGIPLTIAAVAAQVTAERVAEVFAARKPTRVVRYDLPKLAAFNFVLDDVLEGGVNASLGLDGHGKSLSFLVLDIPIEIAAETSRRSIRGTVS